MKYFILGIICLIIAGVFGKFQLTQMDILYNKESIKGWVPNIAFAGASCGFAIAGGLCILASAIVEKAKK